MRKVIEFSLRNRFLILMLTVLATGAGLFHLRNLPIDAVPDITPNQVLLITRAPGLGPLEVEQFITFPVEASMSGLPGIKEIRSVSRFGLSVVTVFFEEDLDLYFARRLVMERLPQAAESIPPGFGTPEMGPISTGLGEIYQFEVKGEGRTAMELRSILDWDIALKLRSVPGVVEVNTYGGEVKTYEVQLDSDKLVSYRLSLQEVMGALEKNNFSAGGASIEHNQEQQVIRSEGLVGSLEDIENIVISAEGGTPVFVRNVAKVAFAPMVRQGAVTRDGRGEVVTGVVMMLSGGNSRVVAEQVREKLEEVAKSLPAGVTLDTYYDRTELVHRTIRTVIRNLAEGGILVVVVLFLMLGNARAGLVVASAIPLSMLIAFTSMSYADISGNLMSLGAIDFGLIVDGAVILVENAVRRMSGKAARLQRALTGSERVDVVRDASVEVLRAAMFGGVIIMAAYLPILTLAGVEGKMFRPMALTVIFALAGALVLSMTVIPVLSSFFLGNVREEKETGLVRAAKRIYLPALRYVLERPFAAATGAGLSLALGALAATGMGGEFIPRLDEGSLAIQAWRLPSVALSESVASTTLIEKELKKFPEVVTVVSRTGQAEIPTDPMGVEISDIYVMLKPQEQWSSAKTLEELISKLNGALEKSVPGNLFSYSQPIELRMQELIAGVRSDIAIQLYGEDLDVLKQKADEIVRVVSDIPGAQDTKAEQVAGLPYLRIRIDRRAIARYGLNASQVLDVVEAMGGRTVGEVMEGQRRFALQVRFQESDRNNIERIRNIKVADPQGGLIPLSQLAEIWVEQGPAQISRENVHRMISVETNVRGRDIASFVAEAEKAIGRDVKLPAGYWVVWGGQFRNLEEAAARLEVAVPLAFFVIFLLLYMTFHSVKPALLIFLNVPVAATGGILALVLKGMPFSISAGVGFIALFGVAVLNGLVLVTYIRQLRDDGMSAMEAALHAGEVRLRPVLMTAMVASFGFLPMAISTGAGAEVQKPLATVVIGGLVTSTILTLLVLPAIYRWFDQGEAAPAEDGSEA